MYGRSEGVGETIRVEGPLKEKTQEEDNFY